MRHLRAVVLVLLAAGPLAAGPARATTGWVSPLAGPLVVRRGFHPPAERWLAGHRGVDLAGRAGQVVRAAGPGLVTFAGVLAGRGVVVVSHGALRTTYEPVHAAVRVGVRVTAGTPIGVLATGHGSPTPGETLLHWGLLRGERYLNPLTLLRRGPPRLLPLWSTSGGTRPESGLSGLTLPRHQGVNPAHSSLPRRPPTPGAGAGAVAVAGMGAVVAVMTAARRRRTP